jgi:hypothetical protein
VWKLAQSVRLKFGRSGGWWKDELSQKFLEKIRHSTMPYCKPCEWKVGKIIMIVKEGKNPNYIIYRPISLCDDSHKPSLQLRKIFSSINAFHSGKGLEFWWAWNIRRSLMRTNEYCLLVSWIYRVTIEFVTWTDYEA